MAPIEPRYVEFRPDDLWPVLPFMERMAASHTGWINFEPAIHEEDTPPERSGLFGNLFTARGPDVPLATWTPGEARRGGAVGRAMLGILHASGPKAAKRVDIPTGWVRLQDHAKKGLVVAVPTDVGHKEALTWLLGATEKLSVVPLTGQWRAVVYQP